MGRSHPALGRSPGRARPREGAWRVTWPASPAWLLELQATFGDVLRTPLSSATGTFCADTAAYPAALLARVTSRAEISQAERLAVYHRQYWFRLFTLLQGAFPLTANLIGL